MIRSRCDGLEHTQQGEALNALCDGAACVCGAGNPELTRLRSIEKAARELVAYSNHEADVHASICEHLMGPPGPFPCDCDAPRLIDDLRKALEGGPTRE